MGLVSFFVCLFGTGSHHIALASLNLQILLPSLLTVGITNVHCHTQQISILFIVLLGFELRVSYLLTLSLELRLQP
jgi:hypothetical protein